MASILFYQKNEIEKRDSEIIISKMIKVQEINRVNDNLLFRDPSRLNEKNIYFL